MNSARRITALATVLTISAAEAPMMLRISGSFSPSALSRMLCTCTSLYQPRGKSFSRCEMDEPMTDDEWDEHKDWIARNDGRRCDQEASA